MKTRRARASAGTACGALLLALTPALTPTLSATAAESPPPGAESDAVPETGTGRTVIGDGHVDIGARFDHGSWTVQIRDDTTRPATWRNTTDVVLRVGDTAKIDVPESKEFGFLGTPGDPVWLLPQVQQDGVLWPGWNSQEPEVASTVDREVNWQLTGVEGPGDFVLFLNGSFGTPKILFDGRKKLPQETGIEVNSHVHGNWAFTEPGTYLLDVRMTARTKDGKSHDSTRTLQFSVGPQDPSRAFTAKPAGEGSHAASDTPGKGRPEEKPEPPKSSGTDESSAPLWWGVGAAVAAATVGAVLVWRRGRSGRRHTTSSPANDARPEGDQR
ncbi:TIGR03773 family transporter-associated surface protein [Streptomyces scopuliridis]|uniref:TIGR03773 family transporter-associated surface protein n=1 Tax=Streptomyces scopuliridis TaxID=452529 RepID=A0ACD4ZG58_9ACTN|nr:TIGR03773 family transporter-associated surface protein [Streptomyces scopuliridis]WSB96787.1 TIGR03773 family transporter-associated surface protein [Streptomyces scopuliridis]WSC09509.1 TIGR03773 family transporter-associated surface protein [Streptomyces scopuliridis]